MKANRKFIRSDEAVSPVIAVILMVAITVVLAATVYVWVSGFGAQSSNPAKSISLTSDGALATNSTGQYKVYTVASASAGMKYADISLSLAGASLSCGNPATDSADRWQISSGGSAIGCTATDLNRVVSAGDQLTIYDHGASSSSPLSGKALRILDSTANSVMLTLTIG